MVGLKFPLRCVRPLVCLSRIDNRLSVCPYPLDSPIHVSVGTGAATSRLCASSLAAVLSLNPRAFPKLCMLSRLRPSFRLQVQDPGDRPILTKAIPIESSQYILVDLIGYDLQVSPDIFGTFPNSLHLTLETQMCHPRMGLGFVAAICSPWRTERELWMANSVLASSLALTYGFRWTTFASN